MTTTARALARGLRQVYPGASIEVSQVKERHGLYRVRVPRSIAQEIWVLPVPAAGGETRPASTQRASELLSRWAGLPVWVSETRLMRPRLTRGDRYEIIVRDETAMGDLPRRPEPEAAPVQNGAAPEPPAVMKLWKGNRIDSPFEMTLGDLAAGFMESRYAGMEWPLDRSLTLYLGDPGYVNGTWDDQKAYGALRRLVVERMRAGGQL